MENFFKRRRDSGRTERERGRKKEKEKGCEES